MFSQKFSKKLKKVSFHGNFLSGFFTNPCTLMSFTKAAPRGCSGRKTFKKQLENQVSTINVNLSNSKYLVEKKFTSLLIFTILCGT